MNFDGKVVVITGASSGIGAGAAINFVKCGASVVINGRNEEGLDETIKKCSDVAPKEKNIKVIKVIGDVNDDNVLKKMVDEAVNNFGKIDVLVNNAGTIIDPNGVEKMDMNKYDETMSTNLRSVIILTKLCLPHLEKSKGNIVNISSEVGTRGSGGGNLAYCISKAGMNMLTLNSSVELAAKGIRINAVNPAVIVTPLQKRVGISEKEYQEFVEHAKSQHPLGRNGTVEEVADLIAFLASNLASFITGETVHIDGGRHAVTPT